jgi:hypothetical protein
VTVIERVPPASHLRIAVPAYTGQISVQTASSLDAALPLLLSAGIKVDTDYLAGCCYLDHTRNLMADRFMRSEATDLLFVDADVAFDPASVLRLVASTRPVIAGIYPKKGAAPEFPVAVDADEIWSDDEGNIECAMVPTGFLRINRAVFSALVLNVETYAGPEGPLRAYFKTLIRDGQYVGEDVEFCHRWRSIGGNIHAIANLEFGHVGAKEWRGAWPMGNHREAA